MEGMGTSSDLWIEKGESFSCLLIIRGFEERGPFNPYWH
jgi:hypothetical protein